MPQGHLDGVIVPDLVGLPVRRALVEARLRGFALSSGDPEHPIGVYYFRNMYGVTAQNPIAGIVAPYGSDIIVDIERRGRGGESGDREPRVPKPPASVASLEKSLPVDDVK
jgi:hypothetical protein